MKLNKLECPVCNGHIIQNKLGDYVCKSCGSVLEVEKETDSTPTRYYKHIVVDKSTKHKRDFKEETYSKSKGLGGAESGVNASHDLPTQVKIPVELDIPEEVRVKVKFDYPEEIKVPDYTEHHCSTSSVDFSEPKKDVVQEPKPTIGEIIISLIYCFLAIGAGAFIAHILHNV